MSEDHALESPKTDPEIVEYIEDNRDNDVSSTPSTQDLKVKSVSWTGWYRHPRGGVYKICKDSDGYLVTKPRGGQDAWGSSYTWREVKNGYGLGGVGWYQERRSNNRCS